MQSPSTEKAFESFRAPGFFSEDCSSSVLSVFYPLVVMAGRSLGRGSSSMVALESWLCLDFLRKLCRYSRANGSLDEYRFVEPLIKKSNELRADYFY